jgi:uncharacterized cupin superfamily protein
MPPVNERDVDWTEVEHGESRFRAKQLSGAASDDGDPELGCSLYELPPGGRSWPYHYHAGNAEALYVLAGSGRLRLDGEDHPLEAGDYVPFPTGPAGAHQVVNDGGDAGEGRVDGDDTDDCDPVRDDAPLRFLVVSGMAEPDVTVYPDSGKFGVYAGAAPGGREERTVEGYYRLGDDVSYWEGE